MNPFEAQVEQMFQNLMSQYRMRLTNMQYNNILNLWMNHRYSIIQQLANMQAQNGMLQESQVWNILDGAIAKWLNSMQSQYGVFQNNNNAFGFNNGFNNQRQMPQYNGGAINVPNDAKFQNDMLAVYGDSRQQVQNSKRAMPNAGPQLQQKPISTASRTIIKSAPEAYDPMSVQISGAEGVSLTIGDGYVTNVASAGNVYKVLELDLNINVYDVDILPFALKEAQGYDFVKATYTATMTIDEKPSIVSNLLSIIQSSIDVKENYWKTLETLYETLKDMPAAIAKKIERAFIDGFNRNLSALIGEHEIEPATTLMGIASLQSINTKYSDEILSALADTIAMIKKATVLVKTNTVAKEGSEETEAKEVIEPAETIIRLDKRHAVLTRLKFPGSTAKVDGQTMVVVSSWFLEDSAPDNILEHLLKKQCTENNYTLFMLGTNYTIKYNVTKNRGTIAIVP